MNEPDEDQAKPLTLMPPHPGHLALMMRLVPSKYLPTYEVLHHNHTFLKLFERRGLKSIAWETLWEKKKDDQTHLNLSKKLSIDEQHLYLHYLWKVILESDQRKRDSVFEHIVTQLEVDAEYFLQIHLKQIFLELDDLTSPRLK